MLSTEGLSEWTGAAVGWNHLKAASLPRLHLNSDYSTETTVQSMGLGLAHEVWTARRRVQRENVAGEARERCALLTQSFQSSVGGSPHTAMQAQWEGTQTPSHKEK